MKNTRTPNFPPEAYEMGYLPPGPMKPCPDNKKFVDALLSEEQLKYSHDYIYMKPAEFDKKYGNKKAEDIPEVPNK